jgi:hypothetical protein
MLRNKYEACINKLKNTPISKLKSQMRKHFGKDKKINSMINSIPNQSCLNNTINKLKSNSKYKNKVFNIVKSLLIQGAGNKSKSRSKSKTKSKSRTPSRSKSKTKSKSRTPSRSKTKSKSRTPSKSRRNLSRGRRKRGGDLHMQVQLLFLIFITICATLMISDHINDNTENSIQTCRREMRMRDIEIYEDIFKYPSPVTIQSCRNVLENNNYRVTRRNRQPTKKSNSWW